MIRLRIALLLASTAGIVACQQPKPAFTTSDALGLGPDLGLVRRDPSDVIKIDELYYVWYTRHSHPGDPSGYDATIWAANSHDGRSWTEQGEAIARGPEGSWDEQSVFTPNILFAEGRFWLFYTAVPKPFLNDGNRVTKTAIGVAVAESPDGPWSKLGANPVLTASEDPGAFDSMRVDDACLIVREGRIWLYYKGRQWDNTPQNTRMGVAIADNPEGPYRKYSSAPLVQGGHEVAVWPLGNGVVAMIGEVGEERVANTLQFAEDGVSFSKMAELKSVPLAAGTYRPEAFTNRGEGDMIKWGLQIGREGGFPPFLERVDYTWSTH